MQNTSQLGPTRDRVLIGPEVVQEMEEQMTMIRGRLKEAQDRQNSYDDAHRVERSYEVGDRVFLRVRTPKKEKEKKKASIRFGKGENCLHGLWDLLKS